MTTQTSQPLTNFQAWRLYTRDLRTPDSFIDMGFYYLIAAALQRRVYLGSDDRPLFPNLYIIFVGPPGVGKGLVLTEIGKLLRIHKLKSGLRVDNNPETTMALMNEFIRQNPNIPIPESATNGTTKQLDEPLAIPVAGDCTTFEALLQSHARSLRTMFPQGAVSKLLKNGMYSHSSLCFCLEEVSSLFRKGSKATSDISNYLIRAYDCQNYSYETKTHGLNERILSPCLNFLGGTQQDFVREIFDSAILTQGFASRTFFLSEDQPRFVKYDYFDLDSEQLAAFAQITLHIKKLTNVFGRVRQSPEAYAFIKDYVENNLTDVAKRPNKSPKLEAYYARKNMHVEKLAMAIHFAESVEMVIGVESYRKAIDILDKLEMRMDNALNVGGRNPLAGPAMKIVKYLLANGPKTSSEIWVQFIDDLQEEELVETLKYLTNAGKVMTVGDGNKVKYVALNKLMNV